MLIKKHDQTPARFTLAELRKASPKSKRKLGRIPTPPRSNALERRYYRDIAQVVDLLKSLTNEARPEIDAIISQAIANRPDRLDASSDDIDRVITRLKLEHSSKFDEKEYAAMAQKAFNATDAQSQSYFRKLFIQVAGANFVANESWMEDLRKLFISENVNLIKSIPSQYFDRLQGVISRGVRTGELTKDIAKKIDKTVDWAESRAKFIARDQVAKLYGQMQGLRQVDVGINKYEWSTSIDERVRESHEEKHGNVYKWSKPPSDTGHPGQDYQCRCAAIPVVE